MQDRRLRLALLASYRIPGTCIIPCFGSVCVDNSVALVLAHASAGSLQDVLDRAGPAGLPEPVAAAVMLQVGQRTFPQPSPLPTTTTTTTTTSVLASDVRVRLLRHGCWTACVSNWSGGEGMRRGAGGQKICVWDAVHCIGGVCGGGVAL